MSLSHSTGAVCRRIRVLESKKLRGLHPKLVEHIRQLVTGFQQPERDVGMPFRELPRYVRRHHRIIDSMEHQGRLAEVWLVIILGGVLRELIAERALRLERIMIERQGAIGLPVLQFLARETLAPSPRKLERRRHQDQPLDIRMRRRIEGRKIAAQARSHQDGGCPLHSAIDHAKLAGNRQPFEIALIELRDLDSDAALRELLVEEPGFGRLRAGPETVQVNDRLHLATPNFTSLDAPNLWKSV